MLLYHPRRPSESAQIAFLRGIPLFSELHAHELATLDSVLHQRSYVRDEIIFDEEEEGQAVYFIISGSVVIQRQDIEEPLAVFGAGHYFGELALLSHQPRIAQARATQDAVLAVLFRDDFLKLMATHPNIAERITQHSNLLESQHIPIAPHVLLSNLRDIPGVVTWAGIIASTCLLLLIFKKILWLVVPFLLALILYYMLAPIAKRMVQAGIRTSVAAITLSSAFLLATSLALLLFYPWALANAGAWKVSLEHYFHGGGDLLKQLLDVAQHNFRWLRGENFASDIYLKFKDFYEHFSEKYLGGFIIKVAAWLPSLLLTPVITFFMLKDGAHLRKMLGSAVPNAFFEKTLFLIHAIDRTARLYFIGLIKIALLDTVLVSVSLWLVGLSMPLLLGMLVAVLNWIPYLGPLLGFGIVMMVAATDFPGQLPVIYLILGLFISLRVLDDLVFLPLIVGRNLRIHPLLTLLMFLIGEAIAGVAGLMLTIPIIGIVMVLGETLEIILTDARLMARHHYARVLRRLAANRDLNIHK